MKSIRDHEVDVLLTLAAYYKKRLAARQHPKNDAVRLRAVKARRECRDALERLQAAQKHYGVDL